MLDRKTPRAHAQEKELLLSRAMAFKGRGAKRIALAIAGEQSAERWPLKEEKRSAERWPLREWKQSAER